MATTKITSPDLFDLGSLNTALQLPNGTTAERPTSPSTGEWRYNTTTNLIEFWDGGAWRDLESEDIPPTPSEHFNTVIYDGNGGTNNITGVGFQPDLVWIKQRDTAVENHNWYDSSRGIRNYVVSNSDAANVFGSIQRLNAFDSDGFTVGNDNEINDTGSKYVAWCWKANGGTTASNAEGSITSTVQANAKAGFSMIQYTGDGSSGATIGHGLSSAPEILISRKLTGTAAWGVYNKYNTGSPAGERLKLNTTDATLTTNDYWAGVEPTSTVFSVGTESAVNSSSQDYIVYAFTSVVGYSKIGSYTGNGSDTGPIITTGFEPAWLMIKVTTGLDSWFIVDNKRQTSNPRDERLFANSTAVEASEPGAKADFFTNGFQLRGTGGGQGQVNSSGDTYVYIAIAADGSGAGMMDFLVVGGGGSGGWNSATWDGAGGAGGLRTSYGSTSGGGAASEAGITLAAGTYTITIGAGGYSNSGAVSVSGTDTTITGNASITSTGGGGGGDVTTSPLGTGRVGGSGGGGSNYSGNPAGGAGTTNQGFAGGAGSSSNGGGGGGAGVAGNADGTGGDGVQVSIDGTATYYAGGAAGYNGTGTAGQGGGGTPASPLGGTNTGGGGAGTRSTADSTGGSGIVILRLLTSEYSGTTTGSPTITTDGLYTILKYTGSGTYVHS